MPGEINTAAMRADLGRAAAFGSPAVEIVANNCRALLTLVEELAARVTALENRKPGHVPPPRYR